MTIVPIALIPQIIFSGAVFDLTGWAKVLSYLTISHWCLAALGSTVKINEMASRVAVNDQVLQLAQRRAAAGRDGELAQGNVRFARRCALGGLLGRACAVLRGAACQPDVALRRGDAGTTRTVKEGTDRRTWLLLAAPPAALCTLALVIANVMAR